LGTESADLNGLSQTNQEPEGPLVRVVVMDNRAAVPVTEATIDAD
jgi:hypothetical protein